MKLKPEDKLVCTRIYQLYTTVTKPLTYAKPGDKVKVKKVGFYYINLYNETTHIPFTIDKLSVSLYFHREDEQCDSSRTKKIK